MTRAIKIPIILILTAMFFYGCSSDNAQQSKPTGKVGVKTITAAIQPLETQAAFSGSVEPIASVRLSTKIMGWVEKVHFEEGEQFNRGDRLIKLRSEDLDAKQAQAEAAISAATVHYDNMKNNLKRIESLFGQGAATKKELEDMQAAYASASAKKIQAEKMKVEVDEILKYSNIIAPFAGVVSRKMLQQGDMANPGQPILEIENSDQVKIVAKVPESQVSKLKTGMPVWVKIQAADTGTNGKSAEAQIEKIVPSADPMSRQFDIHVVLDNADGKIFSGMFARVLIAESQETGLFIPARAVFKRGQLEGVFGISQAGKAQLRWITTGSHQNKMVNVLSGLSSGDEVVVESESKLTDGQAVEVK